LQIPSRLVNEAAVETGFWATGDHLGSLVEVFQGLGKLTQFEADLSPQEVGVG
jgi:hypothetical protein